MNVEKNKPTIYWTDFDYEVGDPLGPTPLETDMTLEVYYRLNCNSVISLYIILISILKRSHYK